jgi:hypothetical protein
VLGAARTTPCGSLLVWAGGLAREPATLGWDSQRVFGLRPGEVENNKNKILGCGIRRGFLGCEVENNKNKIFR